ncbi:hypothetical protein CGLO_01700 [Colletotrichum gloeosporioides Cg-14]|uniref:Uncharacterized protein n=1 Tax=Colletotrichum gloeosporioides (strain Cg-14) TaxID=1237896 RepID=T0M3H2_COLGC|nr:hypothetical protein CGLO_01700 [Colletotrichum gloeosporioides Cg-14]
MHVAARFKKESLKTS